MITISNLSKSYKNNQIFADTNCQLRENKISFLIGPNGAGKTTLVKCVFALESYSGKILFNGKSIEEVRDNCLVIWDDCPFYLNLSGLNNLYILSEDKCKKSEIFEYAKEFLGMDVLKRRVSSYSYGQKKRLALALVEILRPKYLFMDEVSNGLDYETIRFLQERIKTWSKTTTIFLTGHQFDFYQDIIDDLFLIKDNNLHLSQTDFDTHQRKIGEIYDNEIG